MLDSLTDYLIAGVIGIVVILFLVKILDFIKRQIFFNQIKIVYNDDIINVYSVRRNKYYTDNKIRYIEFRDDHIGYCDHSPKYPLTGEHFELNVRMYSSYIGYIRCFYAIKLNDLPKKFTIQANLDPYYGLPKEKAYIMIYDNKINHFSSESEDFNLTNKHIEIIGVNFDFKKKKVKEFDIKVEETVIKITITLKFPDNYNNNLGRFFKEIRNQFKAINTIGETNPYHMYNALNDYRSIPRLDDNEYVYKLSIPLKVASSFATIGECFEAYFDKLKDLFTNAEEAVKNSQDTSKEAMEDIMTTTLKMEEREESRLDLIELIKKDEIDKVFEILETENLEDSDKDEFVMILSNYHSLQKEIFITDSNEGEIRYNKIKKRLIHFCRNIKR